MGLAGQWHVAPMDELPPFRSRLLAVCGPVTDLPAARPGRLCTRLFGCEPDVELPGAGQGLAFCAGGDATWATDPTGRVTVVIHGDLPGPTDNAAQVLAAEFAERGVEAARDLDGSFALIVHDAHSQRTWAVTDRANSRWLFHARVDGYHVVTTELAAQPTHRFALDPVGIGWALSSGIAVRGRTLYQGIRILEGGSAHLLTSEGVETRRYWTYAIEDRTGGRSSERLEDELYALLVDGVRRSVADTSDPILSLSVGFDLTAVAGILVRELGYRDIEAFSYARGTPADGSDAQLASRLAGMLGLRLRLVESYHGDFVSHVRRNALGGLANPCEEVDAWYRLGADFAVRANPVVLTGDQRFGGKAIEFSGPEEVRRTVGLRPLRLPLPLCRRIPEAVRRVIEEGQQVEDRAIAAPNHAVAGALCRALLQPADSLAGPAHRGVRGRPAGGPTSGEAPLQADRGPTSSRSLRLSPGERCRLRVGSGHGDPQ